MYKKGTRIPMVYIGMLNKKQVMEIQSIFIAEKVLGKELPKGACVHHVDCNPSNNDPSNLVICPSTGYHALLHQRMRALSACGHTDWKKCNFCKEYDDPNNMYVNSNTTSVLRPTRNEAYHRECHTAYNVAWKRAKRARQKEASKEATIWAQ